MLILGYLNSCQMDGIGKENSPVMHRDASVFASSRLLIDAHPSLRIERDSNCLGSSPVVTPPFVLKGVKSALAVRRAHIRLYLRMPFSQCLMKFFRTATSLPSAFYR